MVSNGFSNLKIIIHIIFGLVREIGEKNGMRLNFNILSQNRN
jgi:hypothetical protein